MDFYRSSDFPFIKLLNRDPLIWDSDYFEQCNCCLNLNNYHRYYIDAENKLHGPTCNTGDPFIYLPQFTNADQFAKIVVRLKNCEHPADAIYILTKLDENDICPISDKLICEICALWL